MSRVAKLASDIIIQIPDGGKNSINYIIYSVGVVVVVSLLILLYIIKTRPRKELTTNEETFRALLSAAASAIFVLQNEMFLYCNPSTEKLIGYTLEDLSKKTFWEIIHPDSLDIVKEIYSGEMNKEGKSKRIECRIVTKNAEQKWIDLTFAGIKFQGKPATVVSVFDITEKKSITEDYENSEQRYRILNEIMSEYAYLNRIDQKGSVDIIWVTESMSRITGYTIEEAKEPNFYFRLLHPEDREHGAEHWAKFVKGEKVEAEGRIITKAGKVLWVSHNAMPILDEQSGCVTYIYGVIRDITERKLKEEEILHHQERLQALTSELIQTQTIERKRLATYLHDSIGQTLAVARMKIDKITNALLEKNPEKTMSENSTLGDEELLNQLNDLSKLFQSSIKETRALTFELSPPILYDLGLVPALDWLLGEMERQHNLTATILNHAGKFSIADEVRDILFEGTREMLMNVIKHANVNSVNVIVESRNSSVCVSVKDNGIGFNTSALEGQNTERKSFGLYNLKERLHNVGGNFEIESVPGQGTCVRLTAPLLDAS